MKKQIFILLGMGVGFLASSYSGDAAQKKVLLVRSEGEKFEEVAATMTRELENSYETHDLVVSKDSTLEQFKSTVEKRTPDLVVLLDNRSVNLALKFNSTQSDRAKRLKGVALMSLNLKNTLKGTPEFSGIAYEPSPLLLVAQFRFIAEIPIKKVTVFYRKSIFQSQMDQVATQLKGEGITLNSINVEQNGTSKEAILAFLQENALKVAKKAGPGEVMWVLLDSMIINQETFNSVWTQLAQQTKLPLITSVENLVDTSMHFCTFAITPNLTDLVTQAMQQVDGILRDQHPPSLYGVEETLSVNTIFNKTRAKEIQLKYNESRLSDIKVIE